MVIGLPHFSGKDGVYVDCVLGEDHQDSFEKSVSWYAFTPLHLVHSDLCVPLSSPFSGCNYFLTFIDEFSIHTWVILKN
jgi:hypothetical protein